MTIQMESFRERKDTRVCGYGYLRVSDPDQAERRASLEEQQRRIIRRFQDEMGIEIIAWYTRRWIVEEFNKAWKTGCRAEERQLEEADRLVPLLGALAIVAAAIAAALAWRALLGPVSTPARLFPLASYPGVEGPPALSPDGNLVAFAWSGPLEDHGCASGTWRTAKLGRHIQGEADTFRTRPRHNVAMPNIANL